jgi:hypothetical protein
VIIARTAPTLIWEVFCAARTSVCVDAALDGEVEQPGEVEKVPETVEPVTVQLPKVAVKLPVALLKVPVAPLKMPPTIVQTEPVQLRVPPPIDMGVWAEAGAPITAKPAAKRKYVAL